MRSRPFRHTDNTGPVAQTKEFRNGPFFPARTTREKRSISVWEMALQSCAVLGNVHRYREGHGTSITSRRCAISVPYHSIPCALTCVSSIPLQSASVRAWLSAIH